MRRIPTCILQSFALLAILLFTSCATTDFFPDAGPSGSKDTSSSAGQPVKKTYVKEILFRTLNDRTDIKIVADGPIRFFAYRLENPTRLAIEMENMGHKLAQPQLIINDKLVDKVTVVNFDRVKKTRAEIWIKVPYSYNVEKEYATINVSIKEDPTSDAAALLRAKKIIDDLNVEVLRLKEKLETMERREEEMFAQPAPQPEFEPVKTEPEEPSIPPVPAPAQEVKAVTPQEHPVKSDNDLLDITKTIQGWREAWEGKDFERYGNYYTPTFPGNAQARIAWLADKRKRFDKAGGIRVEIMNLEAKVEEGKAAIKFTQRYTSGRHSDVGAKTLILVKYGMEWKIESEDWRPGK